MNKEIIVLSNSIFAIQGRFDEKFYSELQMLNKEMFLEYNFIAYSEAYVHTLLISYNVILLDVSLDKWMIVVQKISNNVLAMYSCLGFCARFLGVDLFTLYLKSNDVDLLTKDDVRTYFGDRKSLLLPSKWDLKQLRYMNVDPCLFETIHLKLIGEGAPSINSKLLWEYNL